MPGEPDGGEDAGVAEAGDHDSRPRHAGARRGGRGTNSGTRSTTSWYAGRRSRLRFSIIGMLAPRNIASIATARPAPTSRRRRGQAEEAIEQPEPELAEVVRVSRPGPHPPVHDLAGLLGAREAVHLHVGDGLQRDRAEADQHGDDVEPAEVATRAGDDVDRDHPEEHLDRRDDVDPHQVDDRLRAAGAFSRSIG